MLGSLVRALVAHVTIQKRARGIKQARIRAKKGSRAFRRCVGSSRVLRRLDIVGRALATVQ